MPIKAENLAKYPANWKTEIVPAVRARSGNRCEGIEQYPDCGAVNGLPHPVTGAIVVLTVMHLNHDPSDNRMANLKHGCQRCHNTYDVPHRRKNANATNRAKKALGDLLEHNAMPEVK